MKMLKLLVVFFTIYGHSRYISQSGLVSAYLTEMDVENKEERRNNEQKSQINPIKGHEDNEPEAQSSILVENIENVKSHDTVDYKINDLSQRSEWAEEEQSMLVAGLHLERKRQDAEKLPTQSSPRHPLYPLAAITPTQVSAPLLTPTVTSLSLSFLKDLVTEVLLIPIQNSKPEEKDTHVLEEVIIKTINSEDSSRETNASVRAEESAFTYTAKAATLKLTLEQTSNLTETQKTTITSPRNESKLKPQTSKAPSPPSTETQVKKVLVKAPAKNNKTTVTEKMEEQKSINDTKELQHFPYFMDNYCPPECACYGRVVQCSDKGVDQVPYGIPYNSLYVLLMNNHIERIQLDLLRQYSSMEFLVLTNNRLTDGSIAGSFEGVLSLKRLYLETNLLQTVPIDLPTSLEELRLNNNQISDMSKALWTHCPGLIILSMSNNSLGNGSGSLPNAVLSPLCKLQTLNLDHNQLASVPLGLPLSIKELYLKGNRIEEFRIGAFNGKSELVVLDLSGNRLTNKGLLRDSLLNATHLESLNLEGNQLKQIPQHLPASLKTLNLESNLITSIKKAAFSGLRNLEHLGLARNTIFKVAAGAFRTLPVLHQLDLAHNALRQVPRLLPKTLHSVALFHNKIQAVPRDAFCWGNASSSLSGLVRVQLQNNLIDLEKIDTQAFRCLRGSQVIHFH